ncbi:PREDICTED: histidine-rich glycoprotein-like [Papilio polytes]|uniref:histidine-rich glycoprotein-like n=1 Tax=Papilio polytes TaxID=76194 RepID=UPI0006769F22|nr:PREDICTED: histidine-rich glycoprotein-like [Papilio polytes]
MRAGKMVCKITILLMCAVSCFGYDSAVSHQSVMLYTGHHGELSHFGHHAPEHHEEYAWSYPLYDFSYKVEDPHTHDYKGSEETRDGDKVKGMYWLIQPDGVKRTVKYYVDKDSGYNAVVEYSDLHHHRPKHYEGHHPTSEVYNVVEHHLPHKHHHHHHHNDENDHAKHHHDDMIKPYYDDDDYYSH